MVLFESLWACEVCEVRAVNYILRRELSSRLCQIRDLVGRFGIATTQREGTEKRNYEGTRYQISDNNLLKPYDWQHWAEPSYDLVALETSKWTLNRMKTRSLLYSNTFSLHLPRPVSSISFDTLWNNGSMFTNHLYKMFALSSSSSSSKHWFIFYFRVDW